MRVLIASNHALFGEGLRSLLQERKGGDVEVIGVVSSVDEAVPYLERQNPDLILVDHDDELLNRKEILARFLEAGKQLRVVVLSLHDGGQEALVYDRRTMSGSQVDDWLKEWQGDSNQENQIEKIPEKPDSDSTRRSGMKHFVIVGILVVFVTALLVFGLGQVRLLPDAASAQAAPIDRMFRMEFMVIAFLFALIIVFMLYSIVVFRRKKGDYSDAKHVEGNTRLEVIWTVIPLAVVIYFAYVGSIALADTQKIQEAMEVNVIGQQWSWRFEYPEYGITTTELRLPVDEQALLHLSSVDVIHSFWVPEFRVKQDVLPGEDLVRDLRVTPTQVGDFTLRCAELCGLQHTYMTAPVIVMEKTAFEDWLISQAGDEADPVARGQNLYVTYGCQACHSIDGSEGVGPTWTGLYGSERVFDDGSTTVADYEYLFESIRNPGANIVQGFGNIMPVNVAAELTDQQIDDVISFIESLQ